MRIVIVGAGASGRAYGVMLTVHVGEAVSFVVRRPSARPFVRAVRPA